MLREANHALASDVSQLQYRLTQQQSAIEGLVDVGSADSQEYMHRKLKEFSTESAKHAAEMTDMEERHRVIRKRMMEVFVVDY